MLINGHWFVQKNTDTVHTVTEYGTPSTPALSYSESTYKKFTFTASEAPLYILYSSVILTQMTVVGPKNDWQHDDGRATRIRQACRLYDC